MDTHVDFIEQVDGWFGSYPTYQVSYGEKTTHLMRTSDGTWLYRPVQEGELGCIPYKLFADDEYLEERCQLFLEWRAADFDHNADI